MEFMKCPPNKNIDKALNENVYCASLHLRFIVYCNLASPSVDGLALLSGGRSKRVNSAGNPLICVPRVSARHAAAQEKRVLLRVTA